MPFNNTFLRKSNKELATALASGTGTPLPIILNFLVIDPSGKT